MTFFYSVRSMAITKRNRYHTDERYKQICVKASKKYSDANRELLNSRARGVYIGLSSEKKCSRLEDIKFMRNQGYWKR